MKIKFDVESIRRDFPILKTKVHNRPLVYLDNGATAQKPQVVIDKIESLYANSNASIHRGIHFLSGQMTEAYEGAREVVRRYVNAADRREIVFTAGGTASINTVAYSFAEGFLSEGDNVVVSEMEHHSNIVPWQVVCERKSASVRVLPFEDDGRLEVEKLNGLIDDRTKLIAITQASNVLGSRPDLKRVIAIARERGVAVLVDGCQGIAHGGVDVTELDCDFYAFSGHKLYGPTGIGVLYAKKEWLEKMPPFLAGGDMVDRVSFEKTTYAELPLKFEAGTANYIGAIGLAEAIRYLEQFDARDVEEHERRLMKLASEELERIEGVRIYGTQENKCAIVSFNVEGVHPTDIGMVLDKMGIAIRTGTHCAQPVMQHYGITGMCRASFAIYNSEQEVETFIMGVKRAIAMLR